MNPNAISCVTFHNFRSFILRLMLWFKAGIDRCRETDFEMYDSTMLFFFFGLRTNANTIIIFQNVHALFGAL